MTVCAKGPLVVALLAASASTANGQFLRAHAQPASWSSFRSSSSWVAGSDGNMHKQTHEVRTGTIQDGSMVREVQTQLDCKDGHCTEVVITGQPQRPTHFLQGLMPCHENFPRLHSLIAGWLPDRMHGPKLFLAPAPRIPVDAPLPAPLLADMPELPPAMMPEHAWRPLPGAIVLPPSMMHSPLASRPQLSYLQARAAQEEASARSASALHKAAALISASAALAAMTVAALRFLRCDSAGAREPRLQDLAMPLAAEQEASALAAPRPSQQATAEPQSAAPEEAKSEAAIKAYLFNVYARNANKAAAEAATVYLQNLYAAVAAAVGGNSA